MFRNGRNLADDFFWTFEQAVSYYQFNIINYMGFQDKGMLLARGLFVWEEYLQGVTF